MVGSGTGRGGDVGKEENIVKSEGVHSQGKFLSEMNAKALKYIWCPKIHHCDIERKYAAHLCCSVCSSCVPERSSI